MNLHDLNVAPSRRYDDVMTADMVRAAYVRMRDNVAGGGAPVAGRYPDVMGVVGRLERATRALDEWRLGFERDVFALQMSYNEWQALRALRAHELELYGFRLDYGGPPMESIRFRGYRLVVT